MINVNDDELMFTQEYYINILIETKKLIKHTKKDKDSRQVSELFGIYYNAFAAIIRSGTVIYKKEMEPDGYAKIVMTIGNEKYSCKDVAIRDILRENYELLMRPYEDDAISYVKPFMPEIQYVNKGVMTSHPAIETKEKKSKVKSLLKSERKKDKDVNKTQSEGNIQKTKIPENYKYSDRTKDYIKELDSIGKEIQMRMIGMAASIVFMVMSLILF